MAVKQDCCPRCEAEAKTRVREFSDQAMAALISWGELDKGLISKAICEDCYTELRDSLIDRSSEYTESQRKSNRVDKKVS
jgi:hypothetical protein